MESLTPRQDCDNLYRDYTFTQNKADEVLQAYASATNPVLKDDLHRRWFRLRIKAQLLRKRWEAKAKQIRGL